MQNHFCGFRGSKGDGDVASDEEALLEFDCDVDWVLGGVVASFVFAVVV